MADKPTHVMAVKIKGDRDCKPFYPCKGYCNVGKDQHGDEFDWDTLRDMNERDAIDYIIDHVSFNCYTRPPGENAKVQTHPIDQLDAFIKTLGNRDEIEFRIMRQKPYEPGGGSGRGRGDSGRDEGRGGRDERSGGGRGRDAEEGRGGRSGGRDEQRGGHDDDRGGRGRDDESRGGRRQSFDRPAPDDGYQDDGDDPFGEDGN